MTELSDKRVWIAGQHGMVGSAMMRRLEREGCDLQRDSGRAGVDLRRQSEVEDWIASQRPQVVVLTAGRVGGLCANDTFPADFLYDNLLIEANIIRAAYQTGVDTSVLRLVLHLSARGSPAYSRGSLADRAVGADQ
jgi:GDP-L-fucose synthase